MVLFFVVRFILIFFLLCDLRKNTFRIISRFYLNVVLRVNFFVLKSLLVGACYWEQVFVQKLQSESLCITETLFTTSLLSPTQKTVGLNKIISILIYLKCL